MAGVLKDSFLTLSHGKFCLALSRNGVIRR
jgi:hypothetical protein